MGQSPKSTNYTTNPNDYILVQGNTDIFNGWVRPRIWTKQITKLAKKGDTILSVRAPVGDVSKTRYDIVIGRGVAAISKDEYVFQFLQKVKMNGFWNKITTGSTFESINSSDIQNLTISLSVTQEQKKISDILKAIDDLDLLQQRQLDLYKKIKRGLLQKLFPKDGEKVPEVRFADFHDDWEQHELKDLLSNQYNGQTPNRSDPSFWNGSINWLSSGELNRDIVKKTNEKITYNGQKNSNLKIIPKGTFVMAITGLEASGTRGNCAILGINTTLNQSCMALFPNKNLLAIGFLFQWYKKYGNEFGIRYTQGTKQQSYNTEIINILPISLPSLNEQMKIHNFLLRVDSLITLQQDEINKSKALKKYLLQKLFI